MSACTRRILIAGLVLGALIGAASAVAGEPVAAGATLSPDLIRTAGGERGGPPAPWKDTTTLFSEDFEGAFPGDDWSLYSASSQIDWGVWDCWSGTTSSHSAGCAAGGSAAISCGDYYLDDMQTWMVAGPFDLSDSTITGGALSCILNLASEPTTDYCLIGVSTDMLTFYGLRYSLSVVAETIEIDLSDVPGDLGDVIGESQVWIGFLFVSDSSITVYNGAQIDDVLLTVETAAANVAPEVTLISPNGGESWLAGSQHAITWTASDDDGPDALTVDLDYSSNGGGAWTSLATDLSDTGSYAWTLPTTATSAAAVRITVSDGEDTASDIVDGVFSITAPGDNTLSVGDGSGESGETVSVTLSLENEDAVKGIQADLVFDGTLVSLAGVSASGRGAGLSADGEMLETGRARVLIFDDDDGELAAGDGEVAQLLLTLTGPGGTSTLTLENVVLAGPEAETLAVDTASGSVTVAAPSGVPDLDIAVLKNPGRTRTLQVFVTVSGGSGNAPTVTVGGATLSVADTGLGYVFMGRIHLDDDVDSVTVQASDTNGVGTGTGQVTVELP